MFGMFARGGEGAISVVGAEVVMMGRMKKKKGKGYVKCIHDAEFSWHNSSSDLLSIGMRMSTI